MRWPEVLLSHTGGDGAGTGIRRAGGVEVVHETEDMLVINKPAGVPVHPTGRYVKNTLTEILNAELGYKLYGKCVLVDSILALQNTS